MAGTAPRIKRDPKAALASAQLPRRSLDLCVRGDLVARMQELERELADADQEQKANGALDGGDAAVLARQIEDLRQEMLEHTITVTLTALPRKRWRALLAAHPPREDDTADAALGLNRDSFFDALIRLSTTAPDLDDDDWARLEDVLSDGQWTALTNLAWMVNAQDVDVPFSRRASRILASSAPE